MCIVKLLTLMIIIKPLSLSRFLGADDISAPRNGVLFFGGLIKRY